MAVGAITKAVASMIKKHGASKVRKEISKFSINEKKKTRGAKDKPLAKVSGGAASKANPRGTSKATKKVVSESPTTSSKARRDSPKQIEAKTKRTQNAMAANRRALDKQGSNAGGRTRAAASKANKKK